MYGWLWRHLPGPAWARVIILVLAAAIIVLALFEWGFPWISHVTGYQDQTVG